MVAVDTKDGLDSAVKNGMVVMTLHTYTHMYNSLQVHYLVHYLYLDQSYSNIVCYQLLKTGALYISPPIPGLQGER